MYLLQGNEVSAIYVDILRVNNENLLTQEDDLIMHKRLAYIAIQLLEVHEKK